jgi:hypothetical protein
MREHSRKEQQERGGSPLGFTPVAPTAVADYQSCRSSWRDHLHMQKIGFAEALNSIVAIDNRYSRQAYVFLREALDYTTKQQKKTKGAAGRFTGGELLVVRPDAYAGETSRVRRRRRPNVFETKPAEYAQLELLGSNAPDFVEADHAPQLILESMRVPAPNQVVACSNHRRPNRRPPLLIGV